MSTLPSEAPKKAPTPLEREKKSVVGYLDSLTKDLAIRSLQELNKSLEAAENSDARLEINAGRNAFNLSQPVVRFFDLLLSDTSSDVEVENKGGSIIFSGENVEFLKAASSFLEKQIEGLQSTQNMWHCK